MENTDLFNDRLLPGETIIWYGQPGQGFLLTPRDALLIPFSVVWGGFAIFWESSVVTSKAPPDFTIFGAVFVAIGLFFIFGRFLVDAWLRTRMAYALTDKRILILRWGRWSSFKAVGLDRLPDATMSEGASGRGTIRFGEQGPFWGVGQRSVFGFWVASLDPTPQFLAIEDARAVFAAVQQRVHGSV